MTAKRLDMNHGFIRSIIKNQEDRNRYEIEDKMRTARLTDDFIRDRKPDKKLYHPPTRSNGLFMLEFVDDTGACHNLIVHKDDNCDTVAEKMGNLASLPPHLVAALRERLKQEFKEKPA